MITWVVPDLNLFKLSQWLANLNAAPVVCLSLCATISSIPQCELPLDLFGYFIKSNKIILEVEFVYGWKVPVLFLPDWHERF